MSANGAGREALPRRWEGARPGQAALASAAAMFVKLVAAAATRPRLCRPPRLLSRLCPGLEALAAVNPGCLQSGRRAPGHTRLGQLA